MLVPIDDITVKRRIRKDMGDISTLAESMRSFGQISPIVITKKNVLVAGGRRLEAARSLGWKSIRAVEVDAVDELLRLQYEVEENIQRRDFSAEEAADASKRLYRLQNRPLLFRIIAAIIAFFKRLFGGARSLG